MKAGFGRVGRFENRYCSIAKLKLEINIRPYVGFDVFVETKAKVNFFKQRLLLL